VLRHDIDADPGAAFELATIEAEMGIEATFFLMLRSPIYNVFSRANPTYVRGIIEMGHTIGLHYDEGFWPGDRHTLEEWIRGEADFLGATFGVEINAVSFHQPGPRVLNNDFKLPGFINTYDRIDMAGLHYVSDSSKVWRGADIVSIFSERMYPRIQLLIHPMWWMTDADEPGSVIWEKVLTASFLRAQEQLLQTERAYGGRREFVIVPSTPA